MLPLIGRIADLRGRLPVLVGSLVVFAIGSLVTAAAYDLPSMVTGRRIRYMTIPFWAFRIGGLFDASVRETEELLPRYRADNVFDSSKFAGRFPEFEVTPYRQGIEEILGV